ncbi:MAG: CCA tRNA nucleotidyltransferase [Bacteroidales bacterium]|nr:CCA tRNA nucleotidyltransferase [Bacteroidales bacterium]
MDVALKHPIYPIIGRVADSMGLEAYAVGGVVRDYFLQRPCSDIDVVCVGSGIALAEAVAAQLPHPPEVHVYRNFGTAQFHYHHDGVMWEIEFVGARRESYQHDSRKPIVEDGTLEDDQNRRDFTVNAMAVCLNAGRYGELVDPFGGIRDLNDGILRTPLEPGVTFSDDPLRMMRAVRFASQLGFRIEDSTFQAICDNAERIKIVSQERITTELNKILLSPRPSVGLRLLQRTGLLPLFFPELSKLRGVETINGRSHKDNFYHTLEVVDNVAAKSDDLWLRWAALLHDIGKPATKHYDDKLGWTFHGHEAKGAHMVKRIFARLRLPLDAKMKYVEKLVMLHLRPIVISEDVVTDSAVRRLLFEAGDDIDDLMLLCEADITSKQEEKKKRFRENYQLVRQKLVELEEKDRIRNFQPPVSGDDIMRAFNLEPCATIGIIKDAIKDAILDGTIANNRSVAWQMMLDMGKELGLTAVYTEDPKTSEAPQS